MRETIRFIMARIYSVHTSSLTVFLFYFTNEKITVTFSKVIIFFSPSYCFICCAYKHYSQMAFIKLFNGWMHVLWIFHKTLAVLLFGMMCNVMLPIAVINNRHLLWGYREFPTVPNYNLDRWKIRNIVNMNRKAFLRKDAIWKLLKVILNFYWLYYILVRNSFLFK